MVLLLTLLAFVSNADELGSSHVDSALSRALLAFAIARGLNGVISVAQGTEIAIQPAGVGVNFTPGEILDPINDLVEQFSWIMLLSSSSLGVQKVLLSMSAWHGLFFAVAVCGVMLALTYCVKALGQWRKVATRLFLFSLILRFMMPSVIVANDWVYRNFLEQDYQQASISLEQAREAIGDINSQVRPIEEAVEEGFFDRARRVYRDAVEQVDIDRRLEEYRVAAETISENTIKLVVVFLLQSVVFPLIFLFIVWRVFRYATNT